MPDSPSPSTVADASRYRVEERLRDATRVTLRAIRADDKQRLDRHFHSLSTDSVVQRFFKAKADLTADDLAFFTELDFDHHFALVAILEDEQDAAERIVGVGRAIDSGGEPRTAEGAFAVADAHQGRGIGTLLLRRLTAAASAQDACGVIPAMRPRPTFAGRWSAPRAGTCAGSSTSG